MEPRNVQTPIETQKAERERKPRFQIEKVEERIAPCGRLVCSKFYACYRIHYKGKCP